MSAVSQAVCDSRRFVAPACSLGSGCGSIVVVDRQNVALDSGASGAGQEREAPTGILAGRVVCVVRLGGGGCVAVEVDDLLTLGSEPGLEVVFNGIAGSAAAEAEFGQVEGAGIPWEHGCAGRADGREEDDGICILATDL